MKSLCIYLTYDKQNIVDDYIGHMLKELKTCVSHLVVVCNTLQVEKGQDILLKYADQIFYRENTGLDAGGFKDALCSFLGWETVLQYDELVLVNDSFFGPFCPMRDIFDEMHARKLDFWGLLKHGEAVFSNGKHIPEHIQSFFLAVEKRLLRDESFRSYWEEMPFYNAYDEVIENHELKFTGHFRDKGFSYGVLADADVNISALPRNNYNQYGHIAYELICKRNFPFWKKKPVSSDETSAQTQEDFRKCMDYIDKETDYDVGLIWKNLIRTTNAADLYRSFCLRYIIPEATAQLEESKVLLVVFVSCMESIEYIEDYISRLEGRFSIRVCTDDQKVFQYYQREGFTCIDTDRFRTPETIEYFCTYDLVGIVHDVNLCSCDEPNYIGKSYFYHIWENLVKNETHIQGIIKKFQEDPYLGFLMPPKPNFNKYFAALGKGWEGKFPAVLAAVNSLNLNCQVSPSIPPIGVSENFWIRGQIFKAIRNIKKEHVDILSYAWTYIVQHAGFYSGVVESAGYAAMNAINVEGVLGKIISNVQNEFNADFKNFWELNRIIFRGALKNYVEKYDKIYIYGAGYLSRIYKAYFSHIDGYLVLDGQPKQDEIEGIKVKYLSEVDITDHMGIVLCLNRQKQEEVIPTLLNLGIKHFLCVPDD